MRIELTVIDEITGEQIVEIVNDGCSTPITQSKIAEFVANLEKRANTIYTLVGYTSTIVC